jgi:hypothetical protein
MVGTFLTSSAVAILYGMHAGCNSSPGFASLWFPPILTFPRQGGRDTNPAPVALHASPGAYAPKGEGLLAGGWWLKRDLTRLPRLVDKANPSGRGGENRALARQRNTLMSTMTETEACEICCVQCRIGLVT